MIDTNPDGSTTAYAVETDHLGTPRLLTDATQQARWRWTSPPFGDLAPAEDPSGLGKVTFNLRFPGQYYDRESGLSYNWHRVYDAETGRYVQSDPIGLDGGWNTYGYVNGNPLSYTDPRGESVAIPAVIGAGVLICGATNCIQPAVETVVGAMQSAANSLSNGINAIKEWCGDDDDDDKVDCRKASKWDLEEAGIFDEHEYKNDHGAIPWSRFDICKCKDGTIRIAAVGMCGKTRDFWD